jgi:hypothetical protein
MKNFLRNENLLETQFCKLSTAFSRKGKSHFRFNPSFELLAEKYLTVLYLVYSFLQDCSQPVISYITHYLLLHYNRFIYLQPYFCPI